MMSLIPIPELKFSYHLDFSFRDIQNSLCFILNLHISPPPSLWLRTLYPTGSCSHPTDLTTRCVPFISICAQVDFKGLPKPLSKADHYCNVPGSIRPLRGFTDLNSQVIVRHVCIYIVQWLMQHNCSIMTECSFSIYHQYSIPSPLGGSGTCSLKQTLFTHILNPVC